jgi:tetratricopeptide (TPR) repeat protein
MMGQLEEQNKALKESADIPDLKRMSKQTTQSILRQYVQNLYRFFKLFTSAQEFDNPFNHLVLCPMRSNPLYHLITEPDRLFKVIGLNIKQKRYLRAVEFFICLEAHHPERMEATLLQQFGLCYQKLKMYREAIEEYTKADLMKPDSYWTIHHLAQCHRELGHYEKALEYYEMAEGMKPDNLTLTFHVAELLYELGEYEEALPRLHKIDYHHPESLKSLRLLAECCFMSEQGTQAAKYYERMMTEHTAEMSSDDWKHAAYNHWLQGNRHECFRCLSRAEELYEQQPEPSDEEAFAAPFFADRIYADSRFLESLGARKEELGYMYDAYHRTKRGL